MSFDIAKELRRDRRGSIFDERRIIPSSVILKKDLRKEGREKRSESIVRITFAVFSLSSFVT